MKSFRLRLFPKFLLLLLLLAVLPVALVGKIIIGINDESLQFEVQRYHLKLAQSLAEKFDERLYSILAQLALVIDSAKNPSITWADRQKLLSGLIDSSPDFGIIATVTSDGQELIKAYNPQLAPDVDQNPSLWNHATRPLFQQFRRSKRQEMAVIPTPQGTMAEMYVPFETPTGVNAVFVRISIDDICQMVARETIGLTGYAYYISPTGELLSKPRVTTNGANVADKSIVATALNGSLGAREFTDASGMAWIGASAPVRRLGGAIVTQQSRDEAYAASAKGKQQALILTLLVILIVIGAAYVMTRSLVQPLLLISRVAQDVDLSAGRFPSPVEISSNDEMQELAQTFNSMLAKLRGYADLQVEKLIIEQKKTEAIIFSIQDGIVMTDYQGKVQLVSRMARQILGIPDSDDVIGQPLWKYLPSPELKTACVDLLTKPEEQKAIDVKLERSGKDAFYTLNSHHVRTPGKDETLGIVTVIHDVTLEKEIDSMKEEFLHSITHDLRNPLTAIRGFIRLFQTGQTGPLSPIQTKMLETMDKASLRLVTMVNDILDLARLESNRLQLHLEACSVEEIAGRVVELFGPQARGANIALKVEIAGNVPSLFLDPNLIERVFTNLVGNATKFTPDGGAITIHVEDAGDMLRCSVVDTGEGIPASYLEKVFDKFRQVEGHFKGGAGLGLTICKRIVEAHFGKIWIESEVGHGASFIFLLPKNVPQRLEARAA